MNWLRALDLRARSELSLRVFLKYMITIDFSQSKTSNPIADVVFLLNAATSFLYTREIKDARLVNALIYFELLIMFTSNIWLVEAHKIGHCFYSCGGS